MSDVKIPSVKKARRVGRPGLQYAALPYRLSDGGLEILLVTPRDTRRWVIPKGWPLKGEKPRSVTTHS